MNILCRGGKRDGDTVAEAVLKYRWCGETGGGNFTWSVVWLFCGDEEQGGGRGRGAGPEKEGGERGYNIPLPPPSYVPLIPDPIPRSSKKPKKPVKIICMDKINTMHASDAGYDLCCSHG